MAVAAEPEDGRGPGRAAVTTALARGGLWTVVGQVSGLAAALVATPFTIRLLGPARYGLWSLLQSLLQWIATADLGMGGASTRFAGQSHAEGDGVGEAAATWTATIISAGLTGIAAGAGAAFAPLIVTDLLHVHGALTGPGATGLRLVVAGAVLWAAAGSLNTPLQVRLRWPTYTLITSGTSILQVVGIPVCLSLFGGGVVTAAAVSFATTMLAAGAILIIAIRLQPAMRRPRFSRKLARKLITFGGALTVAGLADIPLMTAERFLLGHYRSTTEVAYYAVASRLALLVSIIPAAVSQPLFPATIALRGRGDEEGALAVYRQALQGAFMILTPAILTVAFIARPFLTLWAGPVYGQHSTYACFVILIGVWFSALSWLPLTFLMAVDQAGLIAKIRLLEIPPFLLAAAILTSTMGVMGAAIVWTARTVADSLIFFVVGRRRAELPFSLLSERAWRSLLLPVALGVVLIPLALATSGLVPRAACSIALLALYAVCLWRVVLTQREQTGLRVLAARMNPLRRVQSAT